MPEIIARKQAIARGLNKYFTGKTCSNGHIAWRYTTSGTCEDCIRKSTALSRPVPKVIEGQVVLSQDPRIELLNRGLELKERELDLKERALEIRAQNATTRAQFTDAQIERKSLRAKQEFIKEHMVTFNMLANYEDYDVAVNMVWMAAMIRNPEITKADVITGRQLDRFRYVMRCFPIDKKMLLAETNSIYSRRQMAEAEQFRETAIASVAAAEAAAIDAEWPEFKP